MSELDLLKIMLFINCIGGDSDFNRRKDKKWK